jgi:hypothetical protein
MVHAFLDEVSLTQWVGGALKHRSKLHISPAPCAQTRMDIHPSEAGARPGGAEA